MANLNKVFLIGRLVRDPELRYTPGGTPVADFRLAINRNYVNSAGTQREETCFVDVNVWGKRAEVCADRLYKSREIFIEGRLKMDTWESKEGDRRTKLKVVAESFQFLGRDGRDSRYRGEGRDRGREERPGWSRDREKDQDDVVGTYDDDDEEKGDAAGARGGTPPADTGYPREPRGPGARSFPGPSERPWRESESDWPPRNGNAHRSGPVPRETPPPERTDPDPAGEDPEYRRGTHREDNRFPF